MKLSLFLALLISFLFLSKSGVKAQIIPSNLIIQISGDIFSSEDQTKVPFVNIRIKHSNRGATADQNGFFSMLAYKADTIEFTAIGFQKEVISLNDIDVTSGKYYVSILLVPQVYTLEGVTFFGLNKNNFKEAFLSVKIPEQVSLYNINAGIIPTPEELKLPPPVGLTFSPGEVLKEIPFIKNMSDKKKHKRLVEQVQKDPDHIPIMK